MIDSPSNFIEYVKNLTERVAKQFKTIYANIGDTSVDFVKVYDTVLNEVVTDVVTSAGGRKLYRHSSGMGTVIEFNDGVDRKVLVLDAAYRAQGLSMVPLANMVNTSLSNYNYPTCYVDGGSAEVTPSLCASVTDQTLNQYWPKDKQTSRYNTDVWIAFGNCKAAEHCRSVLVDGVGCDLPNVPTLLRVYCEGVLIDSMDPTVSKYPDYCLTNWFEGISNSQVWTSNEHDPLGSLGVTSAASQLALTSYGRVGSQSAGGVTGCVCPVLEL